jgi:hypothetical protein
MRPSVMIEHDPERVHLERAQVRDHADEHVLEPLFVERQSQVMMVDDVVPCFGTEHDRDHVGAEILADLLGNVLAQMLALLAHLTHPDRHLSRSQVGDRDRL